jgi:serine/threonine protein kinase
MTSSQRIGRYEIVDELGRGGMAIVYRAFDPQFGREVAIKVLPREFLFDAGFRQRFEREAQTIARLEHFAIVPVYDFGEHEGQPYLVMRYMAGGSLAERIEGGWPVALEGAAAITRRIGAALDAAHRRNVIHRDVKPGNVLFDGDGVPYLTDFGIVKLTEATAQLTGGGLVGTPAYMAPEMAQPGGLTPLVDVYALGVLLYQMLSGELPYEADTPMGLLMAHMGRPIPDIREVRPDLPAEVQTVIERAMAKDPADRYQRAGELAAALRDAAMVAISPEEEAPPLEEEPAAPEPEPFETEVAPPEEEEPEPFVTEAAPLEPEEEPFVTEVASPEPPLDIPLTGPIAEEQPLPEPSPGVSAAEPTDEPSYAVPLAPEDTREPIPTPMPSAPRRDNVTARPAPRQRRGVPTWLWVGGVGVVLVVGMLALAGVFGGGPGAAPAEEPATEEMAEEPAEETEEMAEEPMTEEPMTEEPMTEEPMTEEPMTEEPTLTAGQLAATMQSVEAIARLRPDAPPEGWQLTFYEDFSSNRNEWYTGSDKPIAQRLEGGAYVVEFDISPSVYDYPFGYMTMASTIREHEFGSFYTSVEVRQDGLSADSYSISFRAEAPRAEDNAWVHEYYEFVVFEDTQQYYVHGGAIETSTAIRPGEVNRLSILAEGSDFEFYINGELVGTARDDALETGRIWLEAGASPGEPAAFYFDNLEIWTP